MNVTGKVISVNNDRAVVVCQRNSACSSCHDCMDSSRCAAHLIFGNNDGQITVEAHNAVGANQGDEVVLSSPTFSTLVVAAAVFVLPVVFSIMAYIVASLCNFDYSAVLTMMIITFFTSFFIIAKIANMYTVRRISVEIIKILKERSLN